MQICVFLVVLWLLFVSLFFLCVFARMSLTVFAGRGAAPCAPRTCHEVEAARALGLVRGGGGQSHAHFCSDGRFLTSFDIAKARIKGFYSAQYK